MSTQIQIHFLTLLTMESITTETDEEAHNAKVILQKKQREIETKKPYSKDIGEDVTILQPCNDKHLKTIKYYNPRIVS